MFGKSVKHEFRATRRILLPLLVSMLAVSLVVGVLFLLDGLVSDNVNTSTFSIFSSFFSAILILGLTALFAAVAIVSFIMIIRRFYTSFFTDEGYLTFTLPVSVNQHIMSKFTVAFVWQIASCIVALLCVALIGSGAIFGYGMADGFLEGLEIVLESVTSMWSLFEGALGSGYMTAVLILTIAESVLQIVASILMLYLAISLACMIAKRHRVLCGIACYFLVNMAFSTMTSIINSMLAYVEGDYIPLAAMIMAVALTIVKILISYIFTKWILSKKLNLE